MSLKERVKKSKGFLVKEGGFLDYVEMHAFFLGLIPYFLLSKSQFLPMGRDILLVIGLVAIGVKGYDKYVGSINKDILREPQYFWLGMGVAQLIMWVL